MQPTTMITKTIFKKEVAGRQVIVLKHESTRMIWFCGYVSKHFDDALRLEDTILGEDITFDDLGRTAIPGITDDTKFYGFDTANARDQFWPINQQKDYAIYTAKRWAEELTFMETEKSENPFYPFRDFSRTYGPLKNGSLKDR